MPALDRGSLIPLPGFRGLADRASGSSKTLQDSSNLISEHLVKRGTISQEQLSDAEALATKLGSTTADALLKLGYVQDEEIAIAAAEASGASYMDVRSLQIDESVIQMPPESIAREQCVLPIASSGRSLTVIVADPFNLETIEKLQFILDRNIVSLVGSAGAINEAINRHYGTVEGECADSILQEFADSMMQEFTDTQIDLLDTLVMRGNGTMDSLSVYSGDDDLTDEDDLLRVVLVSECPNSAVHHNLRQQ